jgi:hypothetical protein
VREASKEVAVASLASPAAADLSTFAALEPLNVDKVTVVEHGGTEAANMKEGQESAVKHDSNAAETHPTSGKADTEKEQKTSALETTTSGETASTGPGLLRLNGTAESKKGQAEGTRGEEVAEVCPMDVEAHGNVNAEERKGQSETQGTGGGAEAEAEHKTVLPEDQKDAVESCELCGEAKDVCQCS